MSATLKEKLACVRRELAMRKVMYPRWIAFGKMKPGVASNELRIMEAVVADYEGWAMRADVTKKHLAGYDSDGNPIVVETPGLP